MTVADEPVIDELRRLRERNDRLEAALREIIALFTVEAPDGALQWRTGWVPAVATGRWMEIMEPPRVFPGCVRDPVPAVMRGLRERYGDLGDDEKGPS